ncbi:MAG: xanthine dehydrogenase family protein subunit M [Bacteroidota bacterium]|nr:xanthine dehydrogenase family protein subunit M [Bacteroidota bacterium]MDP4215388.1 xanthine dehydrogenase family protein subunit M [Bacteroidota bacterium]MDP4244532.1 xanthine dehydrogenase family protein subunit M [Bacteroidota bacterium]MDP4256059.1 xanthine dehydrogenase family protein subunit M [Bacteroidota bacterium]MDP4259948.1 xanthine dehydrogenase family protein subunit M [Bacteroidota bacterium]
MNPFQYTRSSAASGAIQSLVKEPQAHFLAGGTNLIDLIKMGVLRPERLVDINALPLRGIEAIAGGLRIGALASNSEVADHPLVLQDYPLLAQAINAGASPQLRNMATVGGNIMQRTRCNYFFDTAMPCNKRSPGSGCGALDGYNRMHALFGASEKCIAVNPSDMNVALTALEAVVHVKGPKRDRKIAFSDFHRLPGDHPEKDNTLERTELIISVDLPANSFNRHVHYLKVRDRTSFAFALISVAAALDLEGDKIKGARLAMGGVAHKPWRLHGAEAFLLGKTSGEDVFRQAARIAMQGAKAYKYNQFKLTLAPNAILQALKTASSLG